MGFGASNAGRSICSGSAKSEILPIRAWSAVSQLPQADSSIFLTSFMSGDCLAQEYSHIDLPSSAVVS